MKNDVLVKVFVDDGYVVLGDDFAYEISLEAIPNRAALIEWVYHLSGKTWVTSEVISDFIYEVCTAKKWEIYGHKG